MVQNTLRMCLFVTAVLLVAAQREAAAEAKCPGGGNDACDRWYFEQADKELAGVVTAAIAHIESFAHPDTKQEAKDKLLEGQRAWALSRDLDCQAESALVWLRSARTREGNTASCLRRLTVQRIEALRERYLLKN